MAELQAGLASTDPGARAAAAFALAGAVTVPRDVHAALVKAGEDPDEDVRLGAIWALGHVKSEGADTVSNPYADYDEPPRTLHYTMPVYPSGFDQKVEGIIEVEILVDEQGRVAHARIVMSIAPLDAAALETVKQWKFRPARKAGRPVPVIAMAPVTFRID